MKNKRESSERELGLGTRGGINLQRALAKDGSFNFRRKGQGFFESFELFHWLVSISWNKFIAIVVAWYFFANSFFAGLYLIAGARGIGGMEGEKITDKFWEVFFFSSQTLTTLGYGRLAPVSRSASSIAAIESLFGLLALAIFTGLLYGRFSRAKAKILYSEKALISPYRGGAGFMFRMINKKKSHLIETEVDLVVSMKSREGNNRIFETLSLERSKINFFNLSWTIVHPIDESSPIYGMTIDDLMRSEAEFIVMLKGFDEGFSQNIYSRSSYTTSEVKWGAKFDSMIEVDDDGNRTLLVDKLNSFTETAIPPFPVKDNATTI